MHAIAPNSSISFPLYKIPHLNKFAQIVIRNKHKQFMEQIKNSKIVELISGFVGRISVWSSHYFLSPSFFYFFFFFSIGLFNHIKCRIFVKIPLIKFFENGLMIHIKLTLFRTKKGWIK